jgi:hypothetical protein
MSDLLVGCKIIYKNGEGEKVEGIILKVVLDDSGYHKALVLKQEGQLVRVYLDCAVEIHPDDVRFIYAMNKNCKLREKSLIEKIDRFSLLDL